MQGTWVRALVWEYPTCHRAAKPVRHNYWAHVPTTTEARTLQRRIAPARRN